VCCDEYDAKEWPAAVAIQSPRNMAEK